MEILYGRCEYITVFDAYMDERSVESQLDAFFETVEEEEQVFLISDLYGSSVNQVMCRYANHPNTTLIAGANLALVLGLAGRESITKEELEELIEQSRQMLRIVDMDQVKEEDCSEDDFF